MTSVTIGITLPLGTAAALSTDATGAGTARASARLTLASLAGASGEGTTAARGVAGPEAMDPIDDPEVGPSTAEAMRRFVTPASSGPPTSQQLALALELHDRVVALAAFAIEEIPIGRRRQRGLALLEDALRWLDPAIYNPGD
jgi:hypothetical protein